MGEREREKRQRQGKREREKQGSCLLIMHLLHEMNAVGLVLVFSALGYNICLHSTAVSPVRASQNQFFTVPFIKKKILGLSENNYKIARARVVSKRFQECLASLHSPHTHTVQASSWKTWLCLLCIACLFF